MFTNSPNAVLNMPSYLFCCLLLHLILFELVKDKPSIRFNTCWWDSPFWCFICYWVSLSEHILFVYAYIAGNRGVISSLLTNLTSAAY